MNISSQIIIKIIGLLNNYTRFIHYNPTSAFNTNFNGIFTSFRVILNTVTILEYQIVDFSFVERNEN